MGMEYRIIIYGTGEQYNKNFNIIKYFELSGQFGVAGITAKWMPDSSFLDGYRIIRLEALAQAEFDFIVVMSDIYFEEIVHSLTGMGIAREKIIPYRVLQIPNLDFAEYAKFKDSNVSIISNNCWGGVVCRTLGIECRSPFKNLSIDDEGDYIRLLRNFNHYMGCSLKFLEYAYNENSKKEYPVMLLDDVRVHCNHDANPDDAIEKWNRRRPKINYDNLVAEMYTEDRDVMAEFLKISGYKRNICFVPFESDNDGAYRLALHPGQRHFWEAVNSNAGNGSNSIEYNVLDLMLEKRTRRQA